MYNQYDQNQSFVYQEACKLASEGTEFSHLVKLLSPEYFKRMQIYVQELPYELANKTIFGSVHWKQQSEAKQRKRK